ncbi:hypothetical protein XM61_18525 [Acinetobacter pittii]|uniref:hypothetical protein n=1 Tax=Acinetobacter calcoaceticus/baumannii complex TaxID=909768 RepID=UPI0008084184|nr:hypothetical protein [Acinetobacter pittii]MDD4852451.1 hypothetical protein [Acinetobacter towneri]OCA07220.1 hypothetical protein XM61_18525 [Acinetobacter pittii]
MGNLNLTQTSLAIELSEQDWLKLAESGQYPKPRWMLNSSIEDDEWHIARSGFDIPSTQPYKRESYQILSFHKEIALGELLTNAQNSELLHDLKISFLYLSFSDAVSRPHRFLEIFNSITSLIRHVNELRSNQGKPIIRHLNMISSTDTNEYLKSFGVTDEHFSHVLKLTSQQNNNLSKKDWIKIQSELSITTREVISLQSKLKNYLNNKAQNKASHYTSEYLNASKPFFDVEIDLKPKQKTISNEIFKLELLYTSRFVQKHSFNHSPRELFSDVHSILDNLNPPQKTKLIPAHIALHAMSNALYFVRKYGSELKYYLKSLWAAEKNSIEVLQISPSRVKRKQKVIRKHAFANTNIPDALKELKITTWEYQEAFEKLSHKWIRNNLSVEAAILLYAASMWILLASFTSARRQSLNTLKRNCFRLSPIDGLFDITLRIPKSSERLELEDVHKPIPDLIFDYGIEFSLFVTQLEERQGYFFNESDVYLFGKVLSLHSSSAFNNINHETEKKDFYKFPLSGDTIYKALCFFQDWSQSPLIENKRWYPAQHQFRRLFAVLYFNFSDDNGLEELSWFMGHSSLEQTFHYAEISPSDVWLEEAEIAIARIGSSLHKQLQADDAITEIVSQARKSTEIVAVLEPLIKQMINEHKQKTGKEVRFRRIDGKDIFFYFCNPRR